MQMKAHSTSVELSASAFIQVMVKEQTPGLSVHKSNLLLFIIQQDPWDQSEALLSITQTHGIAHVNKSSEKAAATLWNNLLLNIRKCKTPHYRYFSISHLNA